MATTNQRAAGPGLNLALALTLAMALAAAGTAAAQEFALPGEAALAAMDAAERTGLARRFAAEGGAETELVEPMVMGDVMETMVAERSGRWTAAADGLAAAGVALMFQREEGGPFLRVEDLATVAGPGLRVLLSETRRPADFSQLGDTVDLGPLKAARGNHNYHFEGPWRQFRSAVIVSGPLRVLYAVAQLQ